MIHGLCGKCLSPLKSLTTPLFPLLYSPGSPKWAKVPPRVGRSCHLSEYSQEPPPYQHPSYGQRGFWIVSTDKTNSQSNLRKSLFGLSSCRDSPLWQGGYDNERRPNCGSGNRRHLLTLYLVRKQREANVGTQLALSFFPSPGVVLPLPEVGLPPSVKHLRNLPHRLRSVSLRWLRIQLQ